MAPSPLPAPISVCISSMNRMMPPAAAVTSFRTPFSRSSNSPRYFAPAMREPRSRASSFLSLRLSGTSPLTIRSARPSTIAVLPTPGSPIRTGLFLVRRDRTWTVRRISSSRPMTGSSLPARARLGQVARIFLQRVIGVFGRRVIGRAALAQILDRRVQRLRRHAGLVEDLARLRALVHGEREQQPLDGDETVAGLLRDLLGTVEHAGGARPEIDVAGTPIPGLWAAWPAPVRSAAGRLRERPAGPGRSTRPRGPRDRRAEPSGYAQA